MNVTSLLTLFIFPPFFHFLLILAVYAFSTRPPLSHYYHIYNIYSFKIMLLYINSTIHVSKITLICNLNFVLDLCLT